MSLRSILLGAVLGFAALPAFAQVPMTSPPAVAPVATAPAFDWAGFHIAILAPVYLTSGPVPGVGAAAGYDFAAGRLVFGAEAYVTYLAYNSPYVDIVGRARIGVLVDPVALLYGAFGLGYFQDGVSGWYWHAAIGTELAVTHRVAIRTELAAFRYAPQVWEYQVVGGLVWNFGR